MRFGRPSDALRYNQNLPEGVRSAGTAYMRGGRETGGSRLVAGKALRDWENEEAARRSKENIQSLADAAAERRAVIGGEYDLSRQGLIGKQDRTLAEYEAKQGLNLESIRGKNQAALERIRQRGAERIQGMRGEISPRTSEAKARRKAAGLPSAKDMFGIRKGLHDEFYGNTPTARALQKKYGEDGFELFLRGEMKKYYPAPQKQSTTPALPPDPSHGTITGRGGVLAASRGGQRVDPEQYAQSLLPNAPAKVQQQTAEQPTKRIQTTLPPSPQDVSSDFDPMTSEAFKPPQTLAEFKRKQQLEKGVPALPGQERMASLIDKIRSERALRAGGKRYY